MKSRKFHLLDWWETIVSEPKFKRKIPMTVCIAAICDNGVTCGDSVGFAAVGSGARHAESQFMLAGHSPFSSSPETLLLTYLSKKRSEVAPGVGKGTDMFVIGRGLGSFAMLQNIKDFDMKQIESIYDSVDSGQQKAFQTGMTKTKNYINKIFKERYKKQLKAEEERENQLRAEAARNNPVTVVKAETIENKGEK